MISFKRSISIEYDNEDMKQVENLKLYKFVWNNFIYWLTFINLSCFSLLEAFLGIIPMYTFFSFN